MSPLGRALALLAGALLIPDAQARDHHVVDPGDTVESIALDDAEAAEIRELNGLADGEEPAVGSILILPRGDEQSTMVLMITGEATATPPGGEPFVLDQCMELAPSTQICTGEDSFVTLRLATSSTERRYDDISLLPETCLQVDPAVADDDRRASLVSVSQGAVSVSASEDGHGGRVTVQTPSGVASGVEGGFRVALEEGAARTEAIEGAVNLYGAGERVELEAGEGSRVEAGAAPTPAIKLLLSGDLTHPEDMAALRHPVFRWAEVERALGYRVEIATDEHFTRVVLQEDVAGTEWIPDMLFLPYRVPGIWWRVSSFDRTGFQGVPSAPRALAFPQGVGL